MYTENRTRIGRQLKYLLSLKKNDADNSTLYVKNYRVYINRPNSRARNNNDFSLPKLD